MATDTHPQQGTERSTKRRLALYDPLTGERVRWEGPVYRDTVRGRELARIAIDEFNRLTCDDPRVTLCLGAFDWK